MMTKPDWKDAFIKSFLFIFEDYEITVFGELITSLENKEKIAENIAEIAYSEKVEWSTEEPIQVAIREFLTLQYEDLTFLD